jgi:dienelactone hydrolase
MMKRHLALWTVAVLAFSARAELVKETVEYQHEGETFKGYLVFDNSQEGKRPGVVVVHEWWGLNDYAKMRADQLAEMGYVAFALDMYGNGQVAEDRGEAGKLAGQVRGKPVMRTRAKAGFDVLAANDLVDRDRIAAIGFCFGGTTVLEMAFSGLDLSGVVSFHGGLSPVQTDHEPKAKILILHGAEDPHVPDADVVAFQDKLDKSGADWHLVAYGDAVHAFSNPNAGDDPGSGAAYNEKAAERSWKHMQMFFQEIFE